MSTLIVNGTAYNYPDPGTEPGWGEDATGWAKAVTNALQSLAAAGTIFETQSSIANNITTFTQIPGLQFNSALTLSALVFYRIFRDTDSATPVNEEGILSIIVDNGTWKMSREIVVGETTGVTLDVNGAGEIVYKSTNIAGANYQGIIKFKTIGIIN